MTLNARMMHYMCMDMQMPMLMCRAHFAVSLSAAACGAPIQA